MKEQERAAREFFNCLSPSRYVDPLVTHGLACKDASKRFPGEGWACERLATLLSTRESSAFLRGVRAGLERAATKVEEKHFSWTMDCGCGDALAEAVRTIDPTTVEDPGEGKEE